MSARAITSLALVVSLRYAHGETLLAHSDVKPLDWATPCVAFAVDAAGQFVVDSTWNDNAQCRPADSDACLRERLRARVEALEANRSYDEVLATSPTGVAFVAPTRVRGAR